MQHLKTFSNGQKLDWQIEDDGKPGTVPHPIAYLDGRRIGVIWQCLNMDDDGNAKAPQVVNGKTIVAYFKHDGRNYCLVDGEFDAPKAAREAARETKRATEKAAYLASDEGRARTEFQRKEREYDRVHNDGAYGYNPHRLGDRPTYWTPNERRERHYPEGA